MLSELPLGLLEDLVHDVLVHTLSGTSYLIPVVHRPVRMKDLEQALHQEDADAFPRGCMVFTPVEEDRVYLMLIDPSLPTTTYLSHKKITTYTSAVLSQPVYCSPYFPPCRDATYLLSRSEERWLHMQEAAEKHFADTPVGCFAYYERYDDQLWHHYYSLCYHFALRKTKDHTWQRYVFIEQRDLEDDSPTTINRQMDALKVFCVGQDSSCEMDALMACMDGQDSRDE